MVRFSAVYKRRHGVSGVGGSNPLVPTKIPLKNQPLRAGFFMPAIKKLADARDVILHELILHELIGHLSCAVVTVKSMQANNVNHVCTKTEKAHLHPMLEEMFAVAGK